MRLSGGHFGRHLDFKCFKFTLFDGNTYYNKIIKHLAEVVSNIESKVIFLILAAILAAILDFGRSRIAKSGTSIFSDNILSMELVYQVSCFGPPGNDFSPNRLY